MNHWDVVGQEWSATMAIPDFQTLIFPVLWLAADGAEHALAPTIDVLAAEFSLSDEERAQLNPAGRARTFYNRVAWASSYLRAALLLESTGRGRFRITDRGRSVLAQAPKRIDIPFLMQFPDFKALRDASRKVAGAIVPEVGPADQTPEETFEGSYQTFGHPSSRS
jgi:restriction system protein